MQLGYLSFPGEVRKMEGKEVKEPALYCHGCLLCYSNQEVQQGFTMHKPSGPFPYISPELLQVQKALLIYIFKTFWKKLQIDCGGQTNINRYL